MIAILLVYSAFGQSIPKKWAFLAFLSDTLMIYTVILHFSPVL